MGIVVRREALLVVDDLAVDVVWKADAVKAGRQLELSNATAPGKRNASRAHHKLLSNRQAGASYLGTSALHVKYQVVNMGLCCATLLNVQH